MILMTLVFNGTEEEAKPLLQPLFDLNPAVNAMRMDAYPEANKLIPQEYGLRSSMKGAAFMLPVREQFFNDCKETFEKFIDSCDDAAGSVVAWELFDPSKVAELSTGSFANRGHHLNSLVMPVWKQAENDKRCRQFARDVSNMFKEEIELQGKQASEGLEGGAGVRGKQGAVMLYGNYDVSFSFPEVVVSDMRLTIIPAIRGDLKGHLRLQLSGAAEVEGKVRPDEHV